jgi:hypothetical protein
VKTDANMTRESRKKERKKERKKRKKERKKKERRRRKVSRSWFRASSMILLNENQPDAN